MHFLCFFLHTYTHPHTKAPVQKINFSSPFLQKLSALSASLARVVAPNLEDEVEIDEFPVDGVRAGVNSDMWNMLWGLHYFICSSFLQSLRTGRMQPREVRSVPDTAHYEYTG